MSHPSIRWMFTPSALIIVCLSLPACGQRSAAQPQDAQTADGATLADAGHQPAVDHAITDLPRADGSAPALDASAPPDLGPPPCCKQPSCAAVGTKSEGWADPCTGTIDYGYCASCEVGCKDCGPGCKGNGYYTYCPSLKLIKACNCQACKPECLHVGSWSEGWYDGCTKQLIAWAQCSACKVACVDPSQPRMGLPQPRFYSSCDLKTPLTKTLCIP